MWDLYMHLDFGIKAAFWAEIRADIKIIGNTKTREEERERI